MLMCHVWTVQEEDDGDIEFVEFPKGWRLKEYVLAFWFWWHAFSLLDVNRF